MVLTFSIAAAASADSLAVGGEAVGISVSAQGVIVAGTSSVETENGSISPAEAAGIKKGDIIIKLGDSSITCAEDFTAAADKLDGSKLKLTVLRDGKEKTLSISPAKSVDGGYRLGLWLRSDISGIGTLTYFDPETGNFGALGHGISESATGSLVPISDGSIYDARIVDVKKGAKGSPGELCGEGDESKVIGDIDLNCEQGIFGTAELSCGEILETAEVKSGKAKIRCTVDGAETAEYSVEIVRVFDKDGCICFQLKVTDETLLNLTGGIVQGMSGSPVIQNGCLVGAVTHVFVNDPTSGYGIAIASMLQAAG